MGILSLARPQWGMRQETVQRQGVDVLVALDTSYSMNAEDVAPSRLEKAKSEIRGLIGRLKGDRIGLIAFAGTAIVQCPLTLDYGAASLFLDIADTETIPEPGTSLAAAIQTATSAFIAKERKYKVLVIITDGEDLEGQVQTAIDKRKRSRRDHLHRRSRIPGRKTDTGPGHEGRYNRISERPGRPGGGQQIG